MFSIPEAVAAAVVVPPNAKPAAVCGLAAAVPSAKLGVPNNDGPAAVVDKSPVVPGVAEVAALSACANRLFAEAVVAKFVPKLNPPPVPVFAVVVAPSWNPADGGAVAVAPKLKPPVGTVLVVEVAA